MKKIILASTMVVLLGCIQSVNAEQYNFVNSLPDYLEIQQGDVIVLENLTNSTINIRHTEGLFSSGELYTNGTWTGNFPYNEGIYQWISDSESGTIKINNELTSETVVILDGNEISGNIGTEKHGNLPVAVTTISPSFESNTIPIKTTQNGDFQTKLDLVETGNYEIIVSYNGETIGKISHDVSEKSALEYAETDVLSLRLSILQTLEQILEVLLGK